MRLWCGVVWCVDEWKGEDHVVAVGFWREENAASYLAEAPLDASVQRSK